jgi:hypothetical protein
VKITNSLPKKFALYQNFPNPFNPSTIIRYDLKERGFVNLDIYDILGRKIKSLLSKVQNAGLHEERFDSGNLASGTYFYQIIVNEWISTNKMLLVK